MRQALCEHYRVYDLHICCGEGAWDYAMQADARAMKAILDAKGIPAWVDFWGYDVNHDCPWWRRQLPYFLGRMNLENY